MCRFRNNGFFIPEPSFFEYFEWILIFLMKNNMQKILRPGAEKTTSDPVSVRRTHELVIIHADDSDFKRWFIRGS